MLLQTGNKKSKIRVGIFRNYYELYVREKFDINVESEKYCQSKETVVGRIFIAQTGDSVVKVAFDENEMKGFVEKETSLMTSAFAQIDEYLHGSRKTFTFPIKYVGTAFQIKVWKIIMDIPYGETRTYKQVAILIGSPNAVRAVGHANGKNPNLIITPCHRVVGSDGSLTGYAGSLDVKQKLLKIERSNKQKPDL
ncbi:MAG: methylated-DNA--[protein]-cysteine S-methyltransferase [Dysgonomonas sp.]